MKYQLIESVILVEEERTLSYGIRLMDEDHPDTEIDCIGDISPDRAFVSRLAEQFNREALAPVHFRDAVEDSLK